MRAMLAILVLAGSLLGSVAGGPSALGPPLAAAAEERGCPGGGPFDAGFAALVDRRFGGHHVTAAVHDDRTGCTNLIHPGERVTTASVVKTQIYGAVLLRAQRQGRWLTEWEERQAWPMMTRSADDPASALFSSVGGVAAMDSLSRSLGMADTSSRSVWGLTVTSARDQVGLVHQLLVAADGPLQGRHRQALRHAMESVVPSQRWGIGAGAPPGWPVALKNGFFDSRCCRWRINSVGHVGDPGGGGYSVAILSDGWSTEAAGIVAVETVARVVNAHLATRPYGPFPSRLAFLRQQYGDLFGRAVDVEGVLVWLDAAGWELGRGAGVIDRLLSSGESGRGDWVTVAYAAFAGRRPDPGGMAHWRRAVRGGLGPAGLAAAFAATDEWRRSTDHLDDDQLVDFAFRRVLGRPADPEGFRWWRARLGSTGRAGLVWELAGTAEGAARLGPPAAVVQVYDALLGRLPSEAELADRLSRWAGREAVVGSVLGSAEYRARVGGRAGAG